MTQSNEQACPHVVPRLVSKDGDVWAGSREPVWRTYGDFHWRCALCVEIRDTEWQRYCAD